MKRGFTRLEKSLLDCCEKNVGDDGGSGSIEGTVEVEDDKLVGASIV